MSGENPVVDIRGETCGMPALRVETFLKESSGGTSFTVLGDHPQTMDSLRLVALRNGWRCEISQDDRRLWRALFRPPAP